MDILARIIAPITRRFHPRGTQRILRALFDPQRSHIQSVIPYDADLKIKVNTASYVEWELFFRGYYEEWVINFLKKILRPGDVALDAGANIGTHTLIMAKAVGERGEVLAFDPDPASLKRLRENVELNGFKNIKIMPVALSDKDGHMTLFSYTDELSDQGTASLYDLPKLKKSEMQVEVKTLDEVAHAEKLERMDVVKIDTRGSDFPILRGAQNCIRQFQPLFIFEYNADNWARSGANWTAMKNFFEGRQYVLFLIDKKGIHRIIQEPIVRTSHNILAVPASKLPEIQKYERA